MLLIWILKKYNWHLGSTFTDNTPRMLRLFFFITIFFLPSLCFAKCYLNLFIYFYLWLCWVFVSVQGLSLVAASRCAGLSLSRPLLLQSTGSRRAGSVVVAHGPSHSAACGIFPDQGSNPCPLHWQADSQPLRHQGSPYNIDLYLLAWQMSLSYHLMKTLVIEYT